MSSTAPTSRQHSRTVAVYIALAVTWGSSFLLMKVALDAFSPVEVAVGRIVAGAVTLASLMAATRRRWPRDLRLWGHLAVVGILLCTAPFLLWAWASQYLPSGMAAILNASTPIWTAIVMAIAIRGNRLAPGQLGGIVLGVVGVGTVMGVWDVIADPAFAQSVPAQLACLGATLCYGTAFTWMRLFVTGRHGHDAVTIASMQVVTAAVIALGVLGVVGVESVRPSWGTTAALVALGVLGTGFAYVWNTHIIVVWGPLAASTVTYLTPVVGVIAGAVVLGERVTWNAPVGAVVIIGSVMLVQGRRLPRRIRV
jgi:drug/metabolite transporter (DMT)-like permease